MISRTCSVDARPGALSPDLRFITGIDVSPVMLELARQRCNHLPNVSFELASGRDLAAFESASFDGILAVDCFPYLFQRGVEVVERHLSEAARVLKNGVQVLETWDGAAFHFIQSR